MHVYDLTGRSVARASLDYSTKFGRWDEDISTESDNELGGAFSLAVGVAVGVGVLEGTDAGVAVGAAVVVVFSAFRIVNVAPGG